MEFDKKEYLVTDDNFSYFFEIDRLEQSTSKNVVKKHKAHFARYEIPETVVTDTGTQFTSDIFAVFASNYGFTHVRTSPYHHQSNGIAESTVKQAKKLLRTFKESGDDIYLALLAIRNATQTTHETTPVQCLMNRRTNPYQNS